jgi:acetyl-CoA carboxylase biotin carboxyl carrier protein
MVGTFYRAPSPDSPNFVEEGAHVTEDSVLCIIEAMKVMNEIKAECQGELVKILVANGEAVEYGEPLFHVRA